MKASTALFAAALLMSASCGEGSDSASEPGASGSGHSGSSSTAGSGAETSGGSSGIDGQCDQIASWVEDYRAAHPGNSADINALTPDEVAADPDAQTLLSLCGEDQRPVIPLLAWEYGGSDHAWIDPESSALVYCVYVPVNPSTDHWAYDAAEDHVSADVYVLCPDQNPCRDEQGADQVLACLGDATNSEILVDTASYDDGHDVALELSEASTDLYLVLPDRSKVHLLTNL